MKIALCSSEVVPFAKTGGLADVAGALPIALEELNQEVIVIMPRYKEIINSKFNIKRLSKNISYSTIGKKVKVYFIENEKYFNRDGLYQDKKGDYPDNLERFAYYCNRALELLKEINFSADIIHCNDWQTCLIPVYLKTSLGKDQFYKNIKTVLTIHNLGYQGIFPKDEFPKLGLDWKFFNIDTLEFYNKINFLKGGLIFSDILNTVSKAYSEEIQTNEFGFGLEGVLAQRKKSLFGILNGLDYSLWDPQTDEFIIKKYSVSTVGDKSKNKQDLQKICSLPIKKELPLFGMVSRLAEQKGCDILAEAMEKICKMNLQLIVLGTGEEKYHDIFERLANKYPKVFSLHLKFDNTLAHKIYAGSDIFLMPSKYEPCGLGQLISFKYGTIPLVFKTGGLADTVSPQNGFIFDKYNKSALIKTVNKAIKTFADRNKWNTLILKGMSYNFSWKESAQSYIRLYEKTQPR